MSSLVAGWPETVCGTTVDRQCGSSMQAAFNAARRRSRRATSTSSSRRGSSRCRGCRWARISAANGFEGFYAEDLRALGGGAAGHLGGSDRGGVGPLARGARRVLATSPTGGRSPRSTRAASSVRSSPSRSAPAAPRCSSPSTRTRAATRRSRSSASLQAGFQGGRQDHRGELERDRRRRRGDARHERGRRVAARPRAARARFVSFGLAGVDPYRMLHGNPPACERALAKARPGVGRHRRDRGERGVRVRRPAVPEGHGSPRALGGG